MADFQRPRGTRDFGPDEMARRRAIEERMRTTARLFGFGEVQTPTFEDLALFTARSGEGVVDEMYAFKDKGGRDITLRPELTAPVMRWYLNDMTSAPKPLKLFYFGNCFRYERPQAGRYREFFQFGVEIIGAPLLAADAEIIALADAILKSAGLTGYQLRLGQIGVLMGMLEKLGIPKESWGACLHFLDKGEFEELRRLLDELGIVGEKGDSLVSLAQMKGGPDVLDAASKLVGELEGLAYLRQLAVRLETMDVRGLQFDLGVVRGLDYYTGMVFEIDVPSLGAEKQVCGGGSYALAEVFGGKQIESTGFAIGFDRVLLAIERQGGKAEARGPDVYVVPVGDEALPAALKFLARLRAGGTTADVELMGRNISKALKYADAINAGKAAIIGAKELEDGTVTYRDMATGAQSVVQLSPARETVGEMVKEARASFAAHSYDSALATCAAALEQLKGDGDAPEARRFKVELMQIMSSVSMVTGAWVETLGYLEQVIDLTSSGSDPAAHLGALLQYGDILSKKGKWQLALGRFEEAERHAARGGFDDLQGRALVGKGTVQWRLGKAGDAKRCAERALALAKTAGEDMLAGRALALMASISFDLGDYSVALDDNTKALESFERTGDTSEVSRVLNNMGETYCVMGDFQGAVREFERSLKIAKAAGNRRNVGYALTYLATAYVSNGNLIKARNCALEANEMLNGVEDPYARAYLTMVFGQIFASQGKLDEAFKRFEQSAAEMQKLDIPYDTGTVQLMHARALSAAGDKTAAKALLKSAAKAFDDAGATAMRDVTRKELSKLDGGATQRP